MSSVENDGEVLTTWAERIASAAAPDEVDLAPDVAAAYVAGGVERRQLFAGPRADPGAFGSGVAVVLPYLLDALRVSYDAVRGFLGDPAVNAVVSLASLTVAVAQGRRARAGEPEAPATPAEASVEALSTALTSRGVEQGRARTLAIDVLGPLANDPEGAAAFLEMLRRGRP